MNHALWYRRLAVERLEDRNAPGVFLASWPVEFDVEEPLAVSPAADDDSQLVSHSAEADRTEPTPVEANIAWLLSIAENQPQSNTTSHASPAGTLIHRPAIQPSPSQVADSVRLDLFASLAVERAERVGRASFDRASPPPVPSGRVAGGGGGAASSVAGGATTGGDGAALAEPVAHALPLIDAEGEPVGVALDENTLVVGAATWCPACQRFKTELAAAEPGQFAGLRIVFAFSDEGGDGPGGVRDAQFLDDLPGEVAFLAEDSPRPERYPIAFNAATGQFDLNPYDAINAWLAADSANEPEASATGDAPQSAGEPEASAPGVRGAGSGAAPGANASGSRDASGSGSGVEFETQVTVAPVLSADFNGDGTVGAADYVVWRNHQG